MRTRTTEVSAQRNAPRTMTWRRWRRPRPFAGGVLIVLAGAAIFLSSQLDLGKIQLQLGLEGFQATIIPLGLVLLGILIIAMPVHRIFYGVIALALSVYAIVGANLGGFLIGTLLGCAGGVLAVAWFPPAARDDSQHGDGDGDGVGRGGPSADAESAARGEGRASRARAGRGAAIAAGAAALVLSLTTAALGIGAAPASAAAGARGPVVESWPLCIPLPWIITCPPAGGSPSPTPSQSPSGSPGGAPGDSPAPGQTAGPETPGPETPGPETPSVPGNDGDRGVAPAAPGEQPGPDAGPDAAWAPAVRDDAMVFTSPGAPTTGASLEIGGIPSIALVDVPLADGTTRTVLRLGADRIAMNGFALDAQPSDGEGHGLLTIDDRIELRGQARIYLDSITFIIGGEEFTIGVDGPPPAEGFPTQAVGVRLGLVGVTAESVVHTGSHQYIY